VLAVTLWWRGCWLAGRDIAQVFNTTGRAYVYVANGHGEREAVVIIVLAR